MESPSRRSYCRKIRKPQGPTTILTGVHLKSSGHHIQHHNLSKHHRPVGTHKSTWQMLRCRARPAVFVQSIWHSKKSKTFCSASIQGGIGYLPWGFPQEAKKILNFKPMNWFPRYLSNKFKNQNTVFPTRNLCHQSSAKHINPLQNGLGQAFRICV